MECKRCLNNDMRYFIKHQDQYLCRKCIMFTAVNKESDYPSFNENIDSEYTLTFQLSPKQKELSKQLNKHVLNNQDVLVYAACGAGKTEIILEMISNCLSNKLRVGIAIPRRQVVLELVERFKEYFKHLSVIAVCDGYTDILFADLIILTTHQLYRYENYFDVLVVDEPDAFPFANNVLLNNILLLSTKGPIVYLTATPTKEMLSLKTLTLFERFHGHKLAVPKVVVSFKVILLINLIKFIKDNDKVLLFVPTIKIANTLSKLLNYPIIHSKSENKEAIIESFSNNDFKVLITTTILERGITIEGVNVCVFYSDHNVFNEASLIQIAGRVGRKATYPNGNVLFLSTKKTKKVDTCKEIILMMNA